jgi:hypothetical protein
MERIRWFPCSGGSTPSSECGAASRSGRHMIIASTIASQPSLPDLRFKTAGWATFLGLFLVIPAIVTAILADKIPPVVLIYVPTVVMGNACAIYVLIQFKRLLAVQENVFGLLRPFVILAIDILFMSNHNYSASDHLSFADTLQRNPFSFEAARWPQVA